MRTSYKWIFFCCALTLPISSFAAPLFNDATILPQTLPTEAQSRLSKLVQHTGHLQIQIRQFSPTLKFESLEQIQTAYPTLEFQDPNGNLLQARLSRVLEQPGGYRSWVGTIEGDLHSVAIFTIHAGTLAGEISAFGQTYNIKPLSVGTSAIRTMKLPHGSTHEDVIFKEPTANENLKKNMTPQSLTVEDDGSVIDVYVFYSDDAFAASASIATEIANDIAYTNTALDKSCTQTSLRLVGTSQLTFNETGNGDTYLTQLSAWNDGNYDTIFDTLRTSGADLVQLWVESSLGSAANSSAVGTVAGIAYAAVPNPGFTTGYSVKVRSQPAAVTAHEFGHNFSVWHDRYQCSGIKLEVNYPIETGFGYVDLNQRVRDIMSYSTECSAHGITCTQLPYFSNPRVFINGSRFGIPQQADASYQIYRNRTYIAQNRPAATTPSAPNFSGCMETQSNQMKLDKCFIATAAFGSFLDPHVTQFRQFRDGTLSRSYLGRKFIQKYYDLSPLMVPILENSPTARFIARVGLAFLLILMQFHWALLLSTGILGLAGVLFLRRYGFRLPSLFGVLGIFLFTQFPNSPAEASFLNATPFYGLAVQNPVALISSQSGLLFGTTLTNSTSTYSSASAASLNQTESASAVLESRLQTPTVAFGGAYEIPATENYEWVRSGDGDTWTKKRTGYRLAGAISFSDTFAVGAGFSDQTRTFTRLASNSTGEWGVSASDQVASTQTLKIGGRWIFSPGFSIGGLLELIDQISTDTVQLRSAKEVLSIGYFGLGDAVLHRVDISYIFIPEATASATAPLSPAFQRKTSGFHLESDFRIPVGVLISSLLAGIEYESLTQVGLDGQGSPATISSMGLKLGTTFLDNRAQASVVSSQASIDYRTMKEKSTQTRLLLSMIF